MNWSERRRTHHIGSTCKGHILTIIIIIIIIMEKVIVNVRSKLRDCREGAKAHQNKGVEGASKDVKYKEDKEFVVRESHAIIDPRAMMVHLYDTTITHRTMVCTNRLEARGRTSSALWVAENEGRGSAERGGGGGGDGHGICE